MEGGPSQKDFLSSQSGCYPWNATKLKNAGRLLIWAWSKNGDFTVRSTYKVALKVLKEAHLPKEDGECSDKGKMVGLWKLVW